MLIALLAVLFRGGWFLLLSLVLILCLLGVACYICFILFLLWFAQHPSTIITDPSASKKEDHSENRLVPVFNSTRETDGIHIRLGLNRKKERGEVRREPTEGDQK